MQATRDSNSSNNYSIYEINEEHRNRFDLLTDEEIDALPPHEAKQRLKNATVTTIRLIRNLGAADDDRAKSEKAYKSAIADLSKNQSVANLQENQRNRADFQVMETTTTMSIIQKIISIAAVIASIVITIVCALA